MAKEHIPAGTEVPEGIYRCNACANEYETQGEKDRLPSCSVCDSISWKAYRLSGGSVPGEAKKNG